MKMEEQIIRSAQVVLQAFIDEMREWEIKWNKISKEYDDFIPEYLEKDQLKEVINIQDKCLSKKALSLEQSRRSVLNFRTPPEHDQVITGYEIINKKKIEFLATNEYADLYYKYWVILEDDGWKIDAKKKDSDNWRTRRQLF